MTPKKPLLFLCAFLFSVAGLANSISIEDPACTLTNGNDRFETPTRIGEGSQNYAGQCVDSSRFRPAKIIKNDTNEIVFANYLHEDQYWKATLSKNAKIEKVYFHVVRFDVVSGVTAAHTQFRVRFAEDTPLKLEIQSSEVKKSAPFKIPRDIVISFEASRPEGVSYNFALGAVDNYVSVARVLSGRQRVAENRQSITEQYVINIPKEDQWALITRALEQSDQQGFSRFYNTLRPNCTTDVFDLLDKLPSQVGRNDEPFLTVISNDPVAGPSLAGLEQRGLLGNRETNLGVEEMGFEVDQEKEQLASKNINVFSKIKGHPYSIVIAADEKKQQDEVVQEAKKMAYNLAPAVAQRLGSGLMLSGNNATNAILESLKGLAPLVQKELETINGDLTDEPINISLYLAPWNQTGTKLDALKEMDVKARLPFETYEISYRQTHPINKGLELAASAKSKEEASFGLMAIGIHMNLVKDRSTVSTQIMGHLGSLKEIFPEPEVTPDATVLGAVIPKYSAYEPHVQPLILMDLEVVYNQPIPNLEFTFGPLKGTFAQTSKAAKNKGKLALDTESCLRQSLSVPRLLAKVGPKQLLNATLNISRIDFDLETLSAKSMDVDVKTLALVCLSNQSAASKGLNDAVNDKLDGLKKKYLTEEGAAEQGVDIGLKLINKIFSNNPEGAVSTF